MLPGRPRAPAAHAPRSPAPPDLPLPPSHPPAIWTVPANVLTRTTRARESVDGLEALPNRPCCAAPPGRTGCGGTDGQDELADGPARRPGGGGTEHPPPSKKAR